VGWRRGEVKEVKEAKEVKERRKSKDNAEAQSTQRSAEEERPKTQVRNRTWGTRRGDEFSVVSFTFSVRRGRGRKLKVES